jgi:hypothetical protein
MPENMKGPIRHKCLIIKGLFHKAQNWQNLPGGKKCLLSPYIHWIAAENWMFKKSLENRLQELFLVAKTNCPTPELGDIRCHAGLVADCRCLVSYSQHDSASSLNLWIPASAGMTFHHRR